MFIHLHCHSHYSFLRAVPSPQELVAAAAALEMPAVAQTDTNGLYAAVPFYQAAREAGVKPIVGTQLDIAHETTAATVVLLAANREGYSNLCRLVTQRHLEEKPVSLEAIAEHREGLVALYGPGKGAAEGAQIARLKDI